jgi:hypothetical protein
MACLFCYGVHIWLSSKLEPDPKSPIPSGATVDYWIMAWILFQGWNRKPPLNQNQRYGGWWSDIRS